MPKLGPRSAAICGRVRQEMTRRGFRGTDIADRLAMTKQAVSRRTRAVTPWSVDELDALAAVLEVPFARLVRADEPASALGIEPTDVDPAGPAVSASEHEGAVKMED